MIGETFVKILTLWVIFMVILGVVNLALVLWYLMHGDVYEAARSMWEFLVYGVMVVGAIWVRSRLDG